MKTLILICAAAGLVACGDDDSSSTPAADLNTSPGSGGSMDGSGGDGTGGTAGSGSGGDNGTAGTTTTTTKKPEKRPANKTTPARTGTEPAGMPEQTIVDEFEAACPDLLDSLDLLPDDFYLTDIGNDATCIEPLNVDDIEAQCGAVDDAVWILDSASCVLAIYYDDCMYGATGATDLVVVVGETSDTTIWAQVELYGVYDELLCAWDPDGSDVETCVVDDATGECEVECTVDDYGDCCDDADENDVCDVDEADTTTWVCDDGEEIPADWECDGGDPDCADGSDEVDCG